MITKTHDAPTILVVDDDADIRELLGDVFSEHGFEILAFPDVATAKKHLELRGLPDIAVIDFRLPDGVGTDLCRELRAQNVPCLILSAYPTWMRDAAHPRTDWISKPFEATRLVTAVRDQLRPSSAGSGRDRGEFGRPG